jgi:hypothetical protein
LVVVFAAEAHPIFRDPGSSYIDAAAKPRVYAKPPTNASIACSMLMGKQLFSGVVAFSDGSETPQTDASPDSRGFLLGFAVLF